MFLLYWKNKSLQNKEQKNIIKKTHFYLNIIKIEGISKNQI